MHTNPWVVVLTFFFAELVRADPVYFSTLTPSEAHELGRVNLPELQPTASPDWISYSGYFTVDPKLTQGLSVNYFIWFFETTSTK
jgi:hypothetical protein